MKAAVIIPAHNAASTIAETLEALQRNPAIDRIERVIILDDCSTDATADVARAAWHSQVTLETWRNEVNRGERYTCNAAIQRLASVVEWTFILHADDVVKPAWLSLYFDEMARLPDGVGSICSSYDVWWPDDARVETGHEEPSQAAGHIAGEQAAVIGTLNKGCWWHISGSCIRNSAFVDAGGFAVNMPQLGDWEWLMRFLARGHGIVYLPRSTMFYRQHSRSISSKSFRDARDARERLSILALVEARGWITRADRARRVREVIRNLARRSLVRTLRGDMRGLIAHLAVIVRAIRGEPDNGSRPPS